MQKNRVGKKAVGFGLIFPSMQLVEIAAQCGFDSINVDGEHGHFTPESVDEICRVANGYGMSVTAQSPEHQLGHHQPVSRSRGPGHRRAAHR